MLPSDGRTGWNRLRGKNMQAISISRSEASRLLEGRAGTRHAVTGANNVPLDHGITCVSG